MRVGRWRSEQNLYGTQKRQSFSIIIHANEIDEHRHFIAPSHAKQNSLSGWILLCCGSHTRMRANGLRTRVWCGQLDRFIDAKLLKNADWANLVLLPSDCATKKQFKFYGIFLRTPSRSEGCFALDDFTKTCLSFDTVAHDTVKFFSSSWHDIFNCGGGSDDDDVLTRLSSKPHSWWRSNWRLFEGDIWLFTQIEDKTKLNTIWKKAPVFSAISVLV